MDARTNCCLCTKGRYARTQSEQFDGNRNRVVSEKVQEEPDKATQVQQHLARNLLGQPQLVTKPSEDKTLKPQEADTSSDLAEPPEPSQ